MRGALPEVLKAAGGAAGVALLLGGLVLGQPLAIMAGVALVGGCWGCDLATWLLASSSPVVRYLTWGLGSLLFAAVVVVLCILDPRQVHRP